MTRFSWLFFSVVSLTGLLTACVNSPGYLFSNDTVVAVESDNTVQEEVEMVAITPSEDEVAAQILYETCQVSINAQVVEEESDAKPLSQSKYSVISQDINGLLNKLFCQSENKTLPTHAVYIEPIMPHDEDNVSVGFINHLHKTISHHSSSMGLRVMMKPISAEQSLFLRGSITRKHSELLLHLFLLSQDKQSVIASGIALLPYSKTAKPVIKPSGMSLTR
ncbi:hypothetical protein HR060_02220 [Catenovulum sp. SM1970]|uniref:hypothetical protein n=1 Tax=Marinifaba aquimaris TaxID=2741323 RepID=UPI001573C6AF|nr:hypothetical protein [Marinifaba aquimaris]NTS75671.1 hypothetical protein [Marinifaba aquimaris]